MATVIVRHRVRNYDHWKPIFDDHTPTRHQYGLTAHTLYRDAEDPNMITIIFKTEDPERAREFIGTEDLRETMMRAGIEGTPEIHFLEDIEDEYPYAL